MPVGLDCAQNGAWAIHGLAALTEPNPDSVNLLGTGDSRAEKTWIPLRAFRGPLLLNMRKNAAACLRLPGPVLYPAERRSTSGASADTLYAVARELELGVMAADSVSTLLYVTVCAVQAKTTGPRAARLVTRRLRNVVTEVLQTVFLADCKVQESDVAAARALLVVLLAQQGKDVVTAAASFALLRCALLTRIMELVGLKSAHYLVIGSVMGGCRERPYWRAGRGLCRRNVRRSSGRLVRRALVVSGANRLRPFAADDARTHSCVFVHRPLRDDQLSAVVDADDIRCLLRALPDLQAMCRRCIAREFDLDACRCVLAVFCDVHGEYQKLPQTRPGRRSSTAPWTNWWHLLVGPMPSPPSFPSMG
jgi:hypothetical protein